MMDHILDFDWNYREPEEYFIRPEDLDNSVTEKILHNKFRDPLISSDEEDDRKPIKINWDHIFKERARHQGMTRVYVPGMHKPPLYPKLSALTVQQQYQCLKVICSQYPLVLESEFIPRPTKQDHKVYQELQEIYSKEQKEFQEWAKTLWKNDHCRRALRPRPLVETVYETEFKMKALEMQSFPKQLQLAAQIPLESSPDHEYQIICLKDLISVNILELPQVACPWQLKSQFCILKPTATPEPCLVHPCRFILPFEDKVTSKSLLEVHQALAEFARENGARLLASEAALRCLLQHARPWLLPLSVLQLRGDDGEPTNVVVLGNEFSLSKESGQTRTYKAFKHLLIANVIPDTEKAKLRYGIKARRVSKDTKDGSKNSFNIFQDLDVSSDDDDDKMVIAADTDLGFESPKAVKTKLDVTNGDTAKEVKKSPRRSHTNDNQKAECTCKDTLFENPPPRSYKKWRLKNNTTRESLDLIVHCAHRVRNKLEELILEPILEYQVELGGSARPAGQRRGLALAALLRRSAQLASVRVEAPSGNVVAFESTSAQQLGEEASPGQVAGLLLGPLQQLLGLRPGHYVLKHDAIHRANAILYAPGSGGTDQLVLNFDYTVKHDPEKDVKIPPTLEPVLLPLHKYNKVLPCAFTPHQAYVLRETRKPPAKLKPPPQALQSLDGEATSAQQGQWPKKKGRKRKKN